jgi:hypothetical protein
MRIRARNNLIAWLIVVVVLALLIILSGCAQQPTKITLVHTVSEVVDGQLVQVTNDEATLEALPREWQDVSFKWGTMTLRAGEAAMLHDPWADVTQELGGDLIREAVCLKNPLLRRCTGE